MATNHVKRGANRASAYGKRARASQQQMLPMRTDVQQAAHDAAVRDARRALDEHNARSAAKAAADELSSEFRAAYDARAMAQSAGWSATVTVGWLGGDRSATLVAERANERVAITWLLLDGAVCVPRKPLHTLHTHNARFEDTAAALRYLGAEAAS